MLAVVARLLGLRSILDRLLIRHLKHRLVGLRGVFGLGFLGLLTSVTLLLRLGVVLKMRMDALRARLLGLILGLILDSRGRIFGVVVRVLGVNGV